MIEKGTEPQDSQMPVSLEPLQPEVTQISQPDVLVKMDVSNVSGVHNSSKEPFTVGKFFL